MALLFLVVFLMPMKRGALRNAAACQARLCRSVWLCRREWGPWSTNNPWRTISAGLPSMVITRVMAIESDRGLLRGAKRRL